MDLSAAKGQLPDKAIADLLLLSQRPEFKKLLYVPPINWVLIIACSVSLSAWTLMAQLWLNGDFSLLWMMLLSTYTFFIFILTIHEGCHLVLSRNPRVNDILATVLTFIPLPHLPVSAFRHQHLTHHRDTCGEEDPDDYLYAGPGWLRVLKIFTHDWYWAYWCVVNRRTTSNGSMWINLFGILTSFLVMVVGLSSDYWYEFLVIYAIPQRLGIAVAIYMFAYVQHPPEKCSVKERSPFKTTAILRGFDAPFAKIYFGQNRHLMHHLYPNMPIYRNWRAWQLGKDVFEQQGLVNIGLNAEYFNNISSQNEINQASQQQLLPAVIDTAVRVADGITAYTLIPAIDGIQFPVFKAGAHIDVVIEPGLVRQYSLCNSADDNNRYVIAVQYEKDGRGGSQRLHQTFTPGTRIEISKPRNLFALKPAAEVLLFAGGIGITPMLAMAWTLHHQGVPFKLHYCIGTQAKWAFKKDWQQLPFASSLNVYVDDDPSSPSLDAMQLIQARPHADIYVCGPGGFMDFIERSCSRCDVAAERFNKESFVAGRKSNEPENRAFSVKLAKSGKQFEVPEHKSILQVLKENEIFVPVSCENGICGTCKCTVVAGDVEHRDMVLSDDEKQNQRLFTPCVSRANSDSIEIADY